MIAPFTVPTLEDYGLSVEAGFIAVSQTLLPDYYSPWTTLLSQLPHLLQHETLQENVLWLDVLDTTQLKTPAHWQRAYVTLGYLTQAYIWQNKTKPTTLIPPCLAQPFLDVCEHLGMMPILSYAGLCLWNWQPISVGESSLSISVATFDEIKSSASFTGTRDEDAFNLIPVLTEACGAKLVQPVLDAISRAVKNSETDLGPILKLCATTLQDMAGILSILNQNCDPTIFFQQVRPLLAGSVGLTTDGQPVGVTLRRVNGLDEVIQCVGGSAGQSAYFQFLDQVLGVSHQSTLLLEMRAYMPREHREFLEALQTLPSLRDLVDRQKGNKALQDAFERVLDRFLQWRTKHVAIVTRYIVQPAAALKRQEEKGTAGSSPIPFLKQYRDETAYKPKE
jgi:indoleamine 2,3-dioxygenase